MAASGVALRGGALVPGRDGPAFIAHGGGNKADLLHQALDALWQLLGFFLGWLGAPGKGRALSVGEVKF